MKKIFNTPPRFLDRLYLLLILTLLISPTVKGLSQGHNTPSRIIGTIANANTKYALIRLMDSENIQEDTIKLQDDGAFTFTKDVPMASYFLISIPHTNFLAKVFLENGTSTTFKADMKKPTSYDVTGDLESTYDFADKEDQIYETLDDPTKFKNFKSYNQAISAAKDSLLLELTKEKSEGFKKYKIAHLNDFVDMKRLSYLAVFMKGKKDFDRDPDFNAYIQAINLEDRANLANGKTMNYIYWKAACEAKTNEHLSYPMLQVIKNEIKDKKIADEVAYDISESYFGDGPDKNVDKAYAIAKQILSAQSIAKITPIYKRMRSFSEGYIAPDFDMYTADGKKVRLSDLKGKLIYMDIWATWCGPCRQEIPFMAKVATHYKNNPKIRFVSVSVDNNIAAWKAMIAKDKPMWSQFIATDKASKLSSLYHVDGIPRFMMFDKQGRIITINALRPSEDDIIEEINKYLK